MNNKKNAKNKKQNSGITLIALVVTIVVLIILAVISINAVLGEDGLIRRADLARQFQANAEKADEYALDTLDKEVANLEESIQEGTGGGDSEGGSSSDLPDESWKELTPNERAEKLQDAKPVTYLYYNGDEPSAISKGGLGIYNVDSGHFNTIGYNKLLETEATCECGHARKIFEKAKEMGLVTIYDQIENIEETTTDTDGNEVTKGRTFLTAPITEPSMVYYNFECNNQDQEIGGAIPVPYSFNYQVSLDGGLSWLDGSYPNFDKNVGDYETALTWLGEDYVQLGYTMIRGRSAMYAGKSLAQVGQKFTFNIQVLTQTDFMKAAKALNLDLSSYNCIHPNK